jgi:phosphoglycolate phosphatase
MKYTHIFWDWNGTLLNDVNACIISMNNMLSRRGMQLINEKYYKAVFGFPVIDYYKILGFDFTKESFEELSVEFITEYSTLSTSQPLQPCTCQSLQFFKESNCRQVIVSAMEQQMLEQQIENCGISNYFDSIIGLTNIYASSKVHLAKAYMGSNNLNPSQILFIGDTLHDAEVARILECDLFLVANGHHSLERLKHQKHMVFSSLEFLLSHFN